MTKSNEEDGKKKFESHTGFVFDQPVINGAKDIKFKKPMIYFSMGME